MQPAALQEALNSHAPGTGLAEQLVPVNPGRGVVPRLLRGTGFIILESLTAWPNAPRARCRPATALPLQPVSWFACT